ncbi:MAG TPA: hypothetical protein VF934_10770 [Burkholderiales bacterium]|jgi:hypothetical protein
MSKLPYIVLAAAFGFAAPLYAANTSGGAPSAAWSDAQVKTAMDTCHKLAAPAQGKCIVNIRPTEGTSAAWTDAQISAAKDKCNDLSGTAKAKCIVNIRPVTATGDTVALYSTSSDEATVKHGIGTDEEYSAAVKECDSASGAEKDRCVANVKDHFGRM